MVQDTLRAILQVARRAVQETPPVVQDTLRAILQETRRARRALVERLSEIERQLETFTAAERVGQAQETLDALRARMREMERRRRLMVIARDLERFTLIIGLYYAEQNAWPAEVASGIVPPELSDILPDGFSFQGDGYELDYENLSLPMGLPGNPDATQLIGMAVTADTDELSDLIAESWPSRIVYTVGRKHTVVIDAS